MRMHPRGSVWFCMNIFCAVEVVGRRLLLMQLFEPNSDRSLQTRVAVSRWRHMEWSTQPADTLHFRLVRIVVTTSARNMPWNIIAAPRREWNVRAGTYVPFWWGMRWALEEPAPLCRTMPQGKAALLCFFIFFIYLDSLHTTYFLSVSLPPMYKVTSASPPQSVTAENE